MPILRVQLIHPGAVLPVRVHDGDAGYDLATCETVIVPAEHEVLVPIGIRLELPEGFYARIVGRSSSRLRGLYITESIIDTGYRGAIFVRASGCQGVVKLSKGERLAQLLLTPLVVATIEATETISCQSSDGRGSHGFGSTGGWMLISELPPATL